MEKEKFGAYIAQLRKEKGLTQSELAAKLHVTDKAVSKWERGVGFPDISNVEPLANALGVSVAEVMKSESNPKVFSEQEASEVIIDTISIAKQQKGKLKIRGIALFMLYLAVIGTYHVATDNNSAHYNNLPMPVVYLILAAYLVVTGYILFRAFRREGI